MTALSDDVFAEGVKELLQAPLLTIVSLASSISVQSSVYATTLSVQNIAGSLQGPVNSLVMWQFNVTHDNYDNLTDFILFTSMFDVLGLFLLVLMPSRSLIGVAERIRTEGGSPASVAPSKEDGKAGVTEEEEDEDDGAGVLPRRVPGPMPGGWRHLAFIRPTGTLHDVTL